MDKRRTSIRSLVDPLKLEGKNINAFIVNEYISNGFSSVSVVKNLPANIGDKGFDLWFGKIPWSRKWQPTPVFLPGKFHGQRSLLGYSLWGHKESDTTEHTHTALISSSHR